MNYKIKKQQREYINWGDDGAEVGVEDYYQVLQFGESLIAEVSYIEEAYFAIIQDSGIGVEVEE